MGMFSGLKDWRDYLDPTEIGTHASFPVDLSSEIIGGGWDFLSGGDAADEQKDAAKYIALIEKQIADDQLKQQEEAFNKYIEQSTPFRDLGLAGQNKLAEYLGVGGNQGSADYGKYARDFGASDYRPSPGYSFKLKEELKKMQRQAAARGGLISGNTLSSTNRLGQQLKSEDFMDQYNKYQVNRSNQLQPLQSFSGMAQSMTNAQGDAGQNMVTGSSNALANYGRNFSNSAYGGANATAAGYAGAANLVNSGISTYLNYNQNQNYLNGR